MDAFQGLLGRLNGKNDVEINTELQKSGDRKLAMWAQGRWGGVMFVPGGTLLQGDGYKKAEEEAQRDIESHVASGPPSNEVGVTEKVRRKAGKKRRREERTKRNEAELGDEITTTESKSPKLEAWNTQLTGELLGESPYGQKISSKEKKKKKRERPILSIGENDHAPAAEEEKASSITSPAQVPLQHPSVTRTSTALLRTGRHSIRGRNIEAKKMAFSDLKMLDQV